MLLNGIENPGNKLVYFMAMNNVKFRRPVVPGDQLILDVEMMSRRSKVIQVRGKAFVDGGLVAEGDLAILTPKSSTNKPKRLFS